MKSQGQSKEEYLKDLEQLVFYLSEPNPQWDLIKKLTKKHDIPYVNEPMEQIELILHRIDGFYPLPSSNKQAALEKDIIL